MDLEKEKLLKAGEILNRMANGLNPLNGEPIAGESFLQDARIIRCLFYIKDVLTGLAKGQIETGVNHPIEFSITSEEKSQVKLPAGKIGVNEFAKCVNQALDLNRSKKLTGVELNKRLKAMGLLTEQPADQGKTRTNITEKAKNYGFETEVRNFSGNAYEMVLFNEKGKKFLLDNLESIMKPIDNAS